MLYCIVPGQLHQLELDETTDGYHIRQRVILEARRRAANSDVSMKEIAYYLGFDDTAHFSKFFKTAYGKNFTEFKKESLLLEYR